MEPGNSHGTNPNFQTLLVTGSFTRNDGTTANVGEYLVNRRFLLQRLNWLTYKGPSGPSVANPTGRNIPSSQPGSRTDPDWDMWLLTKTVWAYVDISEGPCQRGDRREHPEIFWFGMGHDERALELCRT